MSTRNDTEQATILITEAFWALKERPNIMFSVSQMKVARLISERLVLMSEDIRTLEGYRHQG